MSDAHAHDPKRARPRLSVTPVYGHCPDCGRRRRVFAQDADATELTVSCNCLAAPFQGDGVTTRFVIQAEPAFVGQKGGLSLSSIGDYMAARARWADALRLHRALSLLAPVTQSEPIRLESVLLKHERTVAEVLSVMPATALSPGVEEWVTVAATCLMEQESCDDVAGKRKQRA